MGIGKRIKEARNSLGLTQDELAGLLGVTKGAVANYENETSHPKEPVMYKMFSALKVDANFLFQDEMNALIHANKTTPDEFEKIIRKYRVLDNHGKKIVETILSLEYERCAAADPSDVADEVLAEINSVKKKLPMQVRNIKARPMFYLM